LAPGRVQQMVAMMGTHWVKIMVVNLAVTMEKMLAILKVVV
jgi:hypothetical protein